MKMKVFAIRDGKAEIYFPPFFQKTHGEAERSLRELMRDESSMVAKYPEDYDLYFLGEYDDQSGKMSLQDTPQHVLKAIQLKSGELEPRLNAVN